MTVKELIEALQKMPLDADVVYSVPCGIDYDLINPRPTLMEGFEVHKPSHPHGLVML